MQISREQFEERHRTSWEGDDFIRRIEDSLGNTRPDQRTWREVAPFVPELGPVLEIGPGTGHLLAAAKEDGRDVVGVETSARHRDYIRTTWGIESIYESLDEVPGKGKFAAAIAINTLEHIYDVQDFLERLSTHVRPGGSVFISTCNGDALLAHLCRTMWSMFKVPDHVSFPSARGIQAVAARAGIRVVRLWSHELPFETPVGIAVAVRDWARELRSAETPSRVSAQPTSMACKSDPAARSHAMRGLIERLAPLDFSTPITSSLRMASSIKAVFSP